MKLWQVIVTGVFVHVILFYSIFDIYFTSPLVHGMTPYTARNDPPAKRLVLFVADGLRADKFFELDQHGKSRAPYLRKVIEEDGAWGVSHTRVPTESRPGHVALIAGFYEDVSAVAKGWKENPVEFDSVFNQSRNTWSWGSPDILPMFAKGATGSHVAVNCYPAHFEDFGLTDMSQLDIWVFKAVKKFFDSAQTNVTVMNALNENKLVFFLHLLGIDTHGHTKKPHSEEYLMNIKVVDAGIKKVVELFKEFYKDDGKTAFVMSSDHGMTNWGSHGAGHPHETLTPLVAWGAGVRQSLATHGSCGNFPDSFCNDWRLQHRTRVDVLQADVAPLMAFLLGIAFPVNSVGMLPTDFLDGTDYDKAEGLFANAQQVLAQYQVKMAQVKDRTISATFRPFKELSFSSQISYVKNIRQLISSGRYQDAISESKYVIETALKGLRYYQTYDRVFQGFSVVMGFLGWMGYVLCLVVAEHTPVAALVQQGQGQGNNGKIIAIFGGLGFVIFMLLLVQSLPWTNYFYCLMPVVLWMEVFKGWNFIYCSLKRLQEQSLLIPLITAIVLSWVGLEIIVLSFFHRELLSVGLLGMAAWATTIPVWKSHRTTCLCWMAGCVLVAVFPLLPVVSADTNYPCVLLAGVIALLLGVFVILRLCNPARHMESLDIVSKATLCFQLAVVVVATLVVQVTSSTITDKLQPYSTAQFISWLILWLCPLLPLLTEVRVEVRLFSLALAFLAPYLLMSITYESLFLLSLMFLLYLWLQMETLVTGINSKQPGVMLTFRPSQVGLDKKEMELPSRHLQVSDLRRAFFFIFFISTAFFGTGNIASINSFDPASVYCFLTVFSPFVMGSLMMLKSVLPFVLVTCVLKAVQVVTRVPLRALMLLILLMSDLMGLNFFFLVTDYGSWLEIGTSISHYIICMSMITFVMVLVGLSQVLTASAPFRDS